MKGFDRSEFYGRMFPRTSFPVGLVEEEDLKSLGKMMKDTLLKSASTPNSGYTYFGQFVDHDLTYDTTELEQRNVEPKQVPNFRSAKLDLELIYGAGPNSASRQLYESDGIRLKIGKTAPSSDGRFPGGTSRDIARDEQLKTPIHADPSDTRNLENLMVMQIHVLFMRFHNEAVKQCWNPEFAALPLSNDTFLRAQQLVRWHYQWLVREDFLSEIGLETVLQDVRNGPKLVWEEENEGFFIPAEFSLAAFRFGHSMVRGEYNVNCHHPNVPLQDLMSGGERPPLQEDWLFEWGKLFDGLLKSSSDTTPSAVINTAIAEPLHNLPEYTKRQHSLQSVTPQPKELPTRTLLRGARASLPTGQEVAAHFVRMGLLDQQQVLTQAQLTQAIPNTTNDASGNGLLGTWMLDRTPLYYYLLKEAEVLGDRTLGPIGTRLVGEVIERVLREDPQSYVRVLGPAWRPPAAWRLADGTGPTRITSLPTLIQLIGDELPQGCEATVLSTLNAARLRFGRRFQTFASWIGFTDR